MRRSSRFLRRGLTCPWPSGSWSSTPSWRTLLPKSSSFTRASSLSLRFSALLPSSCTRWLMCCIPRLLPTLPWRNWGRGSLGLLLSFAIGLSCSSTSWPSSGVVWWFLCSFGVLPTRWVLLPKNPKSNFDPYLMFLCHTPCFPLENEKLWIFWSRMYNVGLSCFQCHSNWSPELSCLEIFIIGLSVLNFSVQFWNVLSSQLVHIVVFCKCCHSNFQAAVCTENCEKLLWKTLDVMR